MVRRPRADHGISCDFPTPRRVTQTQDSQKGQEDQEGFSGPWNPHFFRIFLTFL
jgi:hypothetical protein